MTRFASLSLPEVRQHLTGSHVMPYDPGSGNELAPLDDFGRQDRGALNTGFRAGGGWQASWLARRPG
jgi:hypothetical protein